MTEAGSPLLPIESARRCAIAPMMELTDRHYRYLARLLSRRCLLYTEMLTTGAVLNGDRHYLLGFDPVEEPVVLQLGGSDPGAMVEAAAIGEQWGYSEVNMNVGCPSDRVHSGRFGACLMAEPALVAGCVQAMQMAVSIPVSVKCRLGIDRDDSYAALQGFVSCVADAGCRHFIVHARKAWLDGLSPKENRIVPPLRYEYVYRLKREFPDLHVTINGGIEHWPAIDEHLAQVDGVMLGRRAYYHPACLAEVDARVFDTTDPAPCLFEVARAYGHYMQHWHDRGVRISAMSRHLVALFQGCPGARQWRRHLSEQAGSASSAIQLVEDALAWVSDYAAAHSAAGAVAPHTRARSRSHVTHRPGSSWAAMTGGARNDH